jgi:hypothetical protein
LQTKGDLKSLQKREGQVYCPNWPLKAPDTCPSPPFPDVDIAKHVSPDVFKLHLASRMALTEQRLASQIEEEMQKRVKGEMARLASMDGMYVVLAKILWCIVSCFVELSSRYAAHQRQVEQHRRHIVEEVLTLKCPRCRTAFVDFSGCFAVQCGSCPCNFCGWCLQDCETDAHAHVAHCRSNKANGNVFGAHEQFQVA